LFRSRSRNEVGTVRRWKTNCCTSGEVSGTVMVRLRPSRDSSEIPTKPSNSMRASGSANVTVVVRPFSNSRTITESPEVMVAVTVLRGEIDNVVPVPETSSHGDVSPGGGYQAVL